MSHENITLPERKDWRYRPYDALNVTLQPGTTRPLADLRKHGLVLWAGVTASNPLLDCTVELESESEVYSTTFNMTALIFAGLLAPTPSGWWCSRNDPVNGVFSVMFTPSWPWPFYRRINVLMANNIAVPIQVFRASLLCIEFVDAV